MKKTVYIVWLFLMCWLFGHGQDRVPDNGKLLEFYQTQRYKEAAAYIESFYPDTVADPSVLNRLAYCYRMGGDHLKAEHYYLRLYALDSLDVPTLLHLAAINGQRRRLRLSADYYHRVIAADSTHVRAHTALSGILRMLGDSQAAFEYMRRANQLQPSDGDIAYNFAQLCIMIQEDSAYREADTVLMVALQSDSTNGLLVLAKAQVAEKLKNYLEVVRRCEQLVEWGEETDQVSTLLARGYFHINDFIGCIQTYEKALENMKGMSELDYYYMAMACKALKRYKEGLEYMDRVLGLAISPNAAFYYGRKADLHDLANQPSAAASAYLRSFQFEVVPIHYYSLAILYDKKLQHPKNALRYYRLYLKQEPGEEEQVFVEYVQKRIKELE